MRDTLSHGAAGPLNQPEASGAAFNADLPEQNGQRAKADTHRLMVRSRLEVAQLDADYVEFARPWVMRELVSACSACEERQRCSQDMPRVDANDRLVHYCPNTPMIDALVVSDH